MIRYCCFHLSALAAETERSMDVVGIGALNIDYIKTVPLLSYKDSSHLFQEFEPNREEWLSDENIEQRIRRIGISSFDYIGAGGSAFNTIRCIAQLNVGLETGFIGVAGKPSEECNLQEELTNHNIDSTFAFQSDYPAARSVSLYWPASQGRGTRTSPGANNQLGMFLSAKDTQESVIDYLTKTKWIHFSSLIDRSALGTVVDLIRRAKKINPFIKISFDPGSQYCTDPNVPVIDAIRISDFLFVNKYEFEQLSGFSDIVRAGKKRVDESVMANAIFKQYEFSNALIVLKSYNSTRFFYTFKDVITTRRRWHIPLFPPVVLDDTGAGDIFAAGFITGHLIPALSFDMDSLISVSSDLVKEKLKNIGHNNGDAYQHVVRRALLSIGAKEKYNPAHFVKIYLIPVIFFILGAIASSFFDLIVGKFLHIP